MHHSRAIQIAEICDILTYLLTNTVRSDRQKSPKRSLPKSLLKQQPHDSSIQFDHSEPTTTKSHAIATQ
jgi:hypothetical protein